MKRILSILLAVCLLCSALPSMAQKASKLFSVGFGLEGGVPTGPAAYAYGGMGGATLRFSLHAGPGFATFATGGDIHVAKNLQQSSLKLTTQIPFKAGYKFIFHDHFFVMGELGYSALTNYFDGGNGNVVHNTTGGFTYGPSAGVQFGVMELALHYEAVQLKGGNLSYLGLRLGFNF